MNIKPATYWIGGTILTVALVYGLWALRPLWMQDAGTVDTSPSAPKETLNFADGSSIKIYDIQRGTISHTFPVTGGGSTWGVIGGSSSGSSGDGTITVRHSSSGYGLTDLSFETSSNALLVEFRFCEYGDTSSLPWAVVGENGQIKTLDHSMSQYNRDEWTIDQMIKGDINVETPDFLIQIRNGNGDWISGKTATPCEEDQWLRSVVVFDAWPSSETDLEFRAIRRGQQPQNFSLPNPDVRTPMAWTSKPVPTTIDTTDYTLTLKSVELMQLDLWGEMINPRFSVESKFEGTTNAYHAYLAGVETQHGETPHRHSYKHYPVDPSVEKIKLTARVAASDNYPYARDNALLFGKCVVADDGTIKQVDITNQSLGFKTIKAEKTAGDNNANFEITGIWPSPAAEAMASREVGNWSTKRHVIYIDDNTIPYGGAFSSGGSSSGSGGRTEFQMDFTFNPGAPLKPGQTLTLGFVQPPPDKLHEFIVDRSDFSQKKKDD